MLARRLLELYAANHVKLLSDTGGLSKAYERLGLTRMGRVQHP